MNTHSLSSRHAKAGTVVAVGPLPFTLQLLAAAILFASSGGAYALPVGGAVSAGSATIGSGGGTTTITQSSQNAAINWQSFNIGTGESVNFVQPNGSATALNRVLGADPSSILGSLNANGKVFLVNPNGIVFGQGASVNVGGLVGSTRNISDSDFMAGQYNFEGTGAGSVVNHGTINAKGGSVALLGANVSNQGVIQAQLGTVALAAGNAFTLDVAGDGLLNVAVNKGAVDALVQNGGLIQADGGRVLMTAQSANSLLPSSVNNTGVVRAQTLENHNGTIMLMGDMQSGTVNLAGTLDASAPNGGSGGFVETSAAHVNVASGTKVTTLAPAGKTGTWLIDPQDYVISSTGNISGTTLSNNLATSDVLISSPAGAGNGDILVQDPVTWTATTTLTLSAARDIQVSAPITTTGGNLKLLAVRDVNQNAAISATQAGGNGGNVTMVAGKDVRLNQVLTVTNGNVLLVAANDGLDQGTVSFAAKAVVTGTLSTVNIYYAPTSYTVPTDFTGNFTLTGGATLKPFMWTYLQADNKVYDGNNAAILSLRRNPPGVVAQGGTATFDTANVGTGKTVTYNSYSLGGADSGLYALFAPFSYVTAAASTPGSGTTLANITPAPLAIKANDASKTEGDTLVIPSSAFTSSGLVNGETVGSATLTSLGTAASASATGSPYLINASNATAGTFNPANYTITYAPGNLLIAARPATTPPVTTPPATTPPVTTVPGSTPPGTTPGTTVPGSTSPGTTPGTTVPDTTVPGTTPDTTSPATTVPDTTLPVTTIPGATPPVNTLPGGTTPVSTPVGSTAPNPSATDSTLPSSGIPGLAVAATLPGVPVDQYLGAKTPDIGNTGNPNDPGNPANPGNPSNPGSPGSPGNPAQPGNPSEGRAPHNGRAYIPSLAALTVVGAGINMPASQLAQVTPVLPIQVKDSLGDPAKANTQQIPYPYKAPVYLPRQERN
ncbi:filamentous hemagglutinin N-terminal domain-containing protein [Pseudomonas congelans]|uniref:two-partner secretion domain-containing protein n=1 Tax=Pseudomonas congelans TaxID=200452 RepID=UPI001BDC6D79|nr:filamentous hemagglutinin N-terminal domain-containing protein [Pseudomonas congelans]QVX14647.1 filamentous hemagglutinin N-terminal domain-containing protein [Pseudomonas congelans]